MQDPFPAGWEPFFINCNDSSVEGIKSTPDSGRKVWGVQFHPESAGGPLDTIEVRRRLFFDWSFRLWADCMLQMFTDFLAECRAHKLQLNIPTSQPMDAAKVIPDLTKEAPQRVAVAA